ncbi:hypothetical protein P3J24_004502 [Escherichia coli]|nr:hypothetical protein [Escherichia coli]ELW2702923.1 hypothetical protein [Escherichia coli O26]EKL5493462.1 hypothetical protein [Escherichia coli]EKP3213650.1 hypothetical protein [Escherichia coli]ELB9632936.1 hypothetical protein [Escherichia coli]
MNSDYYSSEHVCKEECPCHLLRSRFKDDKGDWKESVFSFRDANKNNFVPYYFFINEAGYYDLEDDKKHWNNYLYRPFCAQSNKISIEQIEAWNKKENSEKQFFDGYQAKSMESFKFKPRIKDPDIDALLDML